MSNLGRATMQVVEFDMDYCSRTYGSAPCTAVLGTDGVRKCYNTFATCQDLPNYDKGVLTLRFVKNVGQLPKGQNLFPCLTSVSTSPSKISIGAPDDRIGSLGKRARVQIQLNDFRTNDSYTDKYFAERIDGTAQTDEAGYNPQERGTFFTKMRRRFPNFLGRTIRVKNGYVGDDISTIPARTYVVTDWVGPDASGRIQITAQDPIDLTDDKKAVFPAASTGRIDRAIDAGFTGDVSLLPVGVGAEYPASGRATIGSEVMTYTRSGDVVTITARGVDGTEAASHAIDDTFQGAGRFEDAPVYDVVEALLLAANVDAAFLDKTDWTSQLDRWKPGLLLTRTIPKPAGVRTLLNQLCDLGLIIYWDDLTAKIKIRPSRFLEIGEAVQVITDGDNIIEKTLSRKDLTDHLLTQVWIYHGQIDPTEDVRDAANYSQISVSINTDQESANAFGRSYIKKIFQPWLGSEGNSTRAGITASRILSQYSEIPQEVSFVVDYKDAALLELAAFLTLQSGDVVDETGNALPTEMQVTSRDDVDPGHRIAVTVQTFKFSGLYGFIAPNTVSDYGTATAEEKERYVFIAPNSNVFADGQRAYEIF